MRKINNSNLNRSLTQLTEDLVASAPSNRNWKGIGIALVVIAQVIGLVALADYWMTPDDLEGYETGRRILKEEIYQMRFKSRTLNSTWISGVEFVYLSPENGLNVFHAESLKTWQILPPFIYRSLLPGSVRISPDRNFILIQRRGFEKAEIFDEDILGLGEGTCSNHRDWSRANLNLDFTPTWIYSIYNTTSKWHTPFFSSQPLEAVSWSPVGSGLVGVFQHDIYYWTSPSSPSRRLTYTGKLATVYNGVSDWFYRERILCSPESSWFSPDGQSLAFFSINNTEVGKIKGSRLSVSTLHPSLPFPTTGGPLPIVTVYVVNLVLAADPRILNLPVQIKSRSGYLGPIKWITNITLSLTFLSRNQEFINFIHCNTLTLSCTLVHVAEDRGQDLMYSRISEDGSKLLYIGTIRGRSELILKDITTLGGQEIALTAGGLQQVRSLVGWEQKSGNIYYIGSRGKGDENLYRAELGAGGAISSSCLSCSSSPTSSSSSSSSSSLFRVSPNLKFYLQEEMVNVSSVLVSETRLVSLNTGEILSTLDLNHDLKHQISLLSLPRRRFIEFSKERIDLELTLPPTWRSNLEIQFPLFLILQDEMEGYSRPKNGLSWEDYLASEKEYIVGRVYHRKQQISRTKKIKSGNLKFSEVGDILKIIRHLIKNQSYISPSDICILGRSYGAWMVGAVLAEDSERFVSCAVLFNPISHWNKIDTWTSERYLGEIETGFLNYDSADISNYANRFSKRHVSVLVVDESTNQPGQVQQTFSLSKLLVDKGVMFKQMIYPDEKYPGENRPHLVSVIDNFVQNQFSQELEKLPPEVYRGKNIEKKRTEEKREKEEKNRKAEDEERRN